MGTSSPRFRVDADTDSERMPGAARQHLPIRGGALSWSTGRSPVMSVTTLTLFPGERPSRLSRVYFAHDWCNVKIGKSIAPSRRVGGELRISMLFHIPGGFPEERRYHNMWDTYRIGRSEWFRPGDDLLLWLAVNAPDEHSRAAVRAFVYSLKQKRAA